MPGGPLLDSLVVVQGRHTAVRARGGPSGAVEAGRAQRCTLPLHSPRARAAPWHVTNQGARVYPGISQERTQYSADSCKMHRQGARPAAHSTSVARSRRGGRARRRPAEGRTLHISSSTCS